MRIREVYFQQNKKRRRPRKGKVSHKIYDEQSNQYKAKVIHSACACASGCLLVYHESLKRELKTKTIYGFRCDERLKN
jgi:hypothetical protein